MKRLLELIRILKPLRGECFSRSEKCNEPISKRLRIPRYNRSFHSRSLGTNGEKNNFGHGLFLSFALLSCSAYMIGAGADVKETESAIIEQADKWAKEALKDLTDLEQLVLIDGAHEVFLEAKKRLLPKGAHTYRMARIHEIAKELKNQKIAKLFGELQQELNAMKRGEEHKLKPFKYKFEQLSRNSKVPNILKRRILTAREFEPEEA